MNQRIKELRGKAQIAAAKAYPGDPIEDRSYELFAKLIVQECVTVCDSSNYQFGVIFSKMIKEHFGVK